MAEYVVTNYDRLYEETRRFHDTLFASTIPTHVLDAISSQTSILKSTTCLRLEDGTLYGFEGCNNTSGCCEGSCTHVWNYAQALPYLFPQPRRRSPGTRPCLESTTPGYSANFWVCQAMT